MAWRLEVSYPLTKRTVKNLEGLDASFDEAVGQRNWASGGGFGRRDLAYEFETKEEVAAAAKAAKALKVPGTEIEVWEEEDA